MYTPYLLLCNNVVSNLPIYIFIWTTSTCCIFCNKHYNIQKVITIIKLFFAYFIWKVSLAINKIHNGRNGRHSWIFLRYQCFISVLTICNIDVLIIFKWSRILTIGLCIKQIEVVTCKVSIPLLHHLCRGCSYCMVCIILFPTIN